MKLNKWQFIFSTTLCLTPMLLGIYLWNDLPDLIPSHFNFSGEVNDYQSKEFMVFIMPILLCLLNLYFLNRLKKDIKYLPHITIWFIPVLVNALIPISYLIAMDSDISIGQTVFTCIGILFVIVGNYLPKTRYNYYFGIRIPSTLKSEDNWNYTHRMSGPIFMIFGLITTLSGLFQFYLFNGVAFILTFTIPIILSLRYQAKAERI